MSLKGSIPTLIRDSIRRALLFPPQLTQAKLQAILQENIPMQNNSSKVFPYWALPFAELLQQLESKQLCRAALGFKSFKSARITIGGFESMRIIRKWQVKADGNTSAEIFYLMAA